MMHTYFNVYTGFELGLYATLLYQYTVIPLFCIVLFIECPYFMANHVMQLDAVILR